MRTAAFADAGHTRYYSVECSSSKAHKHKPSKAKRGRIRSLVAEIETMVARLEQEAGGEPLPMSQPFAELAALMRTNSSSSSSSSSSSESEVSSALSLSDENTCQW